MALFVGVYPVDTHLKTAPKPPAGLNRAGLALWADVVQQFSFEAWELHLVELLCAHKDAWAACLRAGTQRARSEARAEAVVVARLLRELRLSQVEDSRPPGLAGGRRHA